jgi:hypothetical protein
VKLRVVLSAVFVLVQVVSVQQEFQSVVYLEFVVVAESVLQMVAVPVFGAEVRVGLEVGVVQQQGLGVAELQLGAEVRVGLEVKFPGVVGMGLVVVGFY